MLDLQLTTRSVDRAAFKHRKAMPGDVARVVQGPMRLRDETGKLRVVLVRPAEHDVAPVRTAVRSLPYARNDRSSGMWSRSCVFGFYPRVATRHDFCRAAASAATHPVEHAALVKAATVADQHYREHNPELHAQHDAIVTEKIKPDYRMAGTPFTSGIANLTNPLHYHLDAGNFPDVWSAMFVFRRDVDGGLLVMPEFDLAIDFRDGDLIFFDGQGLLHGVSPITKTHPTGARWSVVFYSLHQLWQCLTPEEELARIRRLRTEREAAPRTLERVKKGKARRG